MKTLLQGKPYTNSANTNVGKTFARIRKQLKQSKDKQYQNIFNMPTAKKA